MLKFLILLSLFSTMAWGFYPADDSSKELFHSLPGKQNEIEEFLKSQISSMNEYNSMNTEYRMTKVPKVEGQPVSEWVPVINEESRKLVVELRITEEGLKSPLVMAEEVMRLNQISSTAFTHPYEWAETVANARKGSVRATEKLARLDVQTSHDLKSWLESNTQFFEGEVDPAKLEQWSSSRKSEALARYKPIAAAAKKELQRLTAEWAKQRPTFTQMERQEKKFNDLVMANDRAGARQMLEKYLPWILMEPSEQNAWKAWLDAMENPDLSKRQLVFRGMDGYPVLRIKGSEKVGVFSSVLAMNQGNYTRRLRSLTTLRERFGIQENWSASEVEGAPKFPKDQPSLIDQMKNHASVPQGSPFISVSDNTIASRFGSSERMALLVDERRLVPNALAFGYGEIERLIPLVIFPDEVVHYQGKVNGQTTYIDNDAFLAKVTEAIGRPIDPKEINAGVDEQEFLKRGFDRLSDLLLEEPGATAIQGVGCVVGMPCDCIQQGFKKLLNE